MSPSPLHPVPVVVRPLHQDDNHQLIPLLNHWVERVPYTARFSPASAETDIFGSSPATMSGVKWLLNRQLGAWVGDTLAGFIDVATSYGAAGEMSEPPQGPPLGFLRFLALPLSHPLETEPGPLAESSSSPATTPNSAPLSAWMDTVAHHLLVEAERFWHEQGVRRVIAFGMAGGYPTFQAGAGAMPGEWSHHFRVLTETGFRLQDRYYSLHRATADVLEEPLPGLKLSLVQRGSDRDRHYVVYQRAEQVAQARLVHLEVDYPLGVNPVGLLASFGVQPTWRGKGVGKWLLRRITNDAVLLGYRRMVFHLHPDDHVAINLFTQTGFQELDFRGYVFEKEFRTSI